MNPMGRPSSALVVGESRRSEYAHDRLTGFFAMRMLHTMLRVTDLERSLAFYTGVLGMNLLRRKDYPNGRFTLAFVGYGPET